MEHGFIKIHMRGTGIKPESPMLLSQHSTMYHLASALLHVPYPTPSYIRPFYTFIKLKIYQYKSKLFSPTRNCLCL